MKPTFRRYDDRPRLPIDARHLFSFRPEKRVALAGENENMRAGTMPVRLLVNSYRKAGHVRAHHAFRHLEKNRRVPFASFRPGNRLDVDRIRDKISFDDTITVQFAAAREITVLAFESIGECIGIVDDEIFTVK